MIMVIPNKKEVVYKYEIIFLSFDYWNVMLLYFLIENIPCRDCGLVAAAYCEFLSDGLEVSSFRLSVETLCMKYVSLLWNYEILKNRNDYVSNNEDAQRCRTKKA